jgi:hypothetical protein
MAKKTPFTWTGRALNHATKHVNAASAYMHKLSQAADMHDRAKAHAEFVQMHLEMGQERTQMLSEVVTFAGNLIGSFVGLLQQHQLLDQMARKSPEYSEVGAEERRRAEVRTPGEVRPREYFQKDETNK